MIFFLRHRSHLLVIHLFWDFSPHFLLRLCRPLSCPLLDLCQSLFLCFFCSRKHRHRRLRLLARHLRCSVQLFLHLRRLGNFGRLICIGQQDTDENNPPLIEIFDSLLIEHCPLAQEDGHVLSIYRSPNDHACFQLVNRILLQHPLALPCESLQIGDFLHSSSQILKTTTRNHHTFCTSSFVSKDTILMLLFLFRSRKSPSIVWTIGNASRRDSSI